MLIADCVLLAGGLLSATYFTRRSRFRKVHRQARADERDRQARRNMGFK